MASVGDIYQVKLFTKVLGQNLLNVFHYQSASAIGNAGELAIRFNLSVWAEVRPLLSSDTLYDHVEVKNVNDPTDFSFWVGTILNGQRGSVSAATHDALSFTFYTTRTDANSGGKRFGALSTTDVIDGALTGSLMTQVATAENAMENNIAGVSAVYVPCVYGQRVGAGLGLKFANRLSSVSYLGITSQNTRKFYTSPGW